MPLLQNLDRKIGKPIDIARFKKSAIELSYLRETQKQFAALAKKIKTSKDSVNVKTCYVCGSSLRKKAGIVYGITYWACQKCTHVYAGLCPGARSMEEFYRKDHAYAEDYANAETYQYRLKAIARPKIDFVKSYSVTKRKRWLDVGCGIGDIVIAAQENGFDAKGIH